MKTYNRIFTALCVITLLLIMCISTHAVSDDNNSIIIGDVNCDGTISIDDVSLLQKQLVGITPDIIINEKCADVNKDGCIDIVDSTEIQKYLAGILSSINISTRDELDSADSIIFSNKESLITLNSNKIIWVVDQEAYSYEEPIYEYYNVCKGCGVNLDAMSTDKQIVHLNAHILAGENDGYYLGSIQVGTNTVYVEEQGHWEFIN